ncbi:Polyamine aminopropyltransferase [bioreactor metagenome]|uniref:Polyamine aminopropyltransferase n=1 Tax=bioreactor metagenome TaxID=1076179 RepID=A0A645B3Z1_9ZZZZ|nr:polyamine aminopropyltransferase [Candidatus Metalachnospira sp.]
MDDLWYSEYHTPNVRFSIKLKSQLHNEQSDYQNISVFDSLEFGRFLTLDGVMMLTERDEFIYHEMITHVPMAVQPDIKNVLVIGAGDGGAARELTKYKSIEHIDIVEIDERVVEVCKEYLPQTACGFEDERITLHFKDGLKFIRHVENEYDLIIVDSTDPSGPGEVLFTKEFYGNCYKALTQNGIMVNQHESPFYKEDAKAMKDAHRRISGVFEVCRVYQAHIPTYPSGHWLFGFASKGLHPVKDIQVDSWNALGLKTKYYNTNLHKGSFYLPSYVEEVLKEVE